VEAILGVNGEAIRRLEVPELREIFLLSNNDLLIEGGFEVFSVYECELDWVGDEGSKEVWGHVGKVAKRENNQVVIQGVPDIVVRVATKQIGFVTFARFVMKLKVVLCKLNLPSGSVGSNFVGLCLVHEVLVIGPNDDR